jgi:hypothetical protein
MIPLWPGWRLVECQMRSIAVSVPAILSPSTPLVVPEAAVDLKADAGHGHHLERVDPVPLVGRQGGAAEVDLLAQDGELRDVTRSRPTAVGPAIRSQHASDKMRLVW